MNICIYGYSPILEDLLKDIIIILTPLNLNTNHISVKLIIVYRIAHRFQIFVVMNE